MPRLNAWFYAEVIDQKAQKSNQIPIEDDSHDYLLH